MGTFGVVALKRREDWPSPGPALGGGMFADADFGMKLGL